MKNISNILFLLLVSFLLINYTIYSQSSFGKVIDFDGDGDYANTFNRPYFPTINGTLEAWVKVRSISPPGGNQGEAFVAKNEEQWNNGDFYAFFEYYSGKLKSRIQKAPSSEVDVYSNSNFLQKLDQWFHYAFTWGSNGMKMYINGVLQNNHNGLTYSALNNDYNFYIGGHGYMLHSGQYLVADFFDGQMDELRVWNYQKNSQQILDLMDFPLDSVYFASIDSGLVGYWKFDVLEDLGINNDGPDDVRDFAVFHNHLDLAGDAHLVSPDPIIPVELTSFIAESNNGHIQLKWSTSTEINNLGFEIERCTENREWITIGFIRGCGTTTELQNYKYFDDLFGVNSKIVFYRLKQIDYNGQYNYSSEIELSVPPAVLTLEQNYPNPFNPSTKIRFALPEKASTTLRIYNSLGECVKELLNEVKEAGNYEVQLDADKLSSGIYFYSLNSGKYQKTMKMILLK